MRPALLLTVLLLAACGVDHTAKGDALAQQRRWKEAIDEYKLALASWAHDYDAAWGIAKIYCFEQKLADKCLAYTTKLLEAYPDKAEYKAAREAGLKAQAEGQP